MQLADQEMQDAVFLEAPVPLFLLERDGTVLRASRRAGHLLGLAPGYATRKAFTALVDLPARLAVRAHLAASRRIGEYLALAIRADRTFRQHAGTR